MALGNQIPDKTLLMTVQRQLSKKCPTSGKVSVDIKSGEATLSGTVRQEHERKMLTKCVSAIQGVSRVVDRVKLEERRTEH